MGVSSPDLTMTDEDMSQKFTWDIVNELDSDHLKTSKRASHEDRFSPDTVYYLHQQFAGKFDDSTLVSCLVIGMDVRTKDHVTKERQEEFDEIADSAWWPNSP